MQPLPAAPAPAEPTALDRLRSRLQSDIDAQTISVFGTPTAVIIRIPEHLVFAQGSASVQHSSLALLERMAAALQREPGAVRVLDYADNQPVRTVRFPSSFQLSDARANAVRDVIAPNLSNQGRVSGEGPPPPTRSRPTARQKAASGTGGSRSSCSARNDHPHLTLDRQPGRHCFAGCPGVVARAIAAWLRGTMAAARCRRCPLLSWGGSNLFLDIQHRRRDAALARGIAARSAEETEEVQALQQRLTTALDLLKNAQHSRGYLYEQPWYAIIGPPGAGKTTALLNAGLRFPWQTELGQGAVAGVGVTRLCDWWFTEDAVLIDTAGRYTTQDGRAHRSCRLGRVLEFT